jgi:hypothetical protein
MEQKIADFRLFGVEQSRKSLYEFRPDAGNILNRGEKWVQAEWAHVRSGCGNASTGLFE